MILKREVASAPGDAPDLQSSKKIFTTKKNGGAINLAQIAINCAEKSLRTDLYLDGTVSAGVKATTS